MAAAKKNTTAKKPIIKKDKKPSIQEVHKFIASLVRYPFKRIAKGCDAEALMTGVLAIINKPFDRGSSVTDYYMEELASKHVRVNLHVDFYPQTSVNVMENMVKLLEPLNRFKGPISHSHVKIQSLLDGKADDIKIRVTTTCSLGNTFLDDNYSRMLLKSTLAFIYNVMYAGMDCSDEVAIYSYQYLQKFFITDEKKELAR